MKNSILIALLFVTATFTACTKGQKGDKGDTGQNGTNGTANTQSYQFSYTKSDWVLDSISMQHHIDIPISGLNQDILDNGAVLVYMAVGSDLYMQLPYSRTTSTETVSYNIFYFLNKLSIAYTNTLQPFNPPSTSGTFKVILIQQ